MVNDKQLTISEDNIIQRINGISIIYCVYNGKYAMRYLKNLKKGEGCSILINCNDIFAEPVTVIYMEKDSNNKRIYKFYNEQIGIIDIFKDDFIKRKFSLSNYADMDKVREWQKHLGIQQKKNKNKDVR